MRSMLNIDIPLNAGCLVPLDSKSGVVAGNHDDPDFSPSPNSKEIVALTI
jgi:hypothetical protein